MLISELAFSQSFSENRKLVDGVVTYEKVIKVDSTMSAKQIYSKSMLFIANDFKSANNVIQLKDELNNSIIVKGNFDMQMPTIMGKTNGYTEFTLSIFCKNGKYKYVINNLHWYQQMKMKLSTYSHNVNFSFDDVANKSNKSSQRILSSLDGEIKIIVDRLHEFIIGNVKNDNW